MQARQRLYPKRFCDNWRYCHDISHVRLHNDGRNNHAPNDRIKIMANGYDATYAAWQNDPQAFWAEAAQAIHWTKTWDRVLDDDKPPFYRWFPGAETNTCYNAVDRHVEAGRGAQAAIIYDSPVTDTIRTTTY